MTYFKIFTAMVLACCDATEQAHLQYCNWSNHHKKFLPIATYFRANLEKYVLGQTCTVNFATVVIYCKCRYPIVVQIFFIPSTCWTYFKYKVWDQEFYSKDILYSGIFEIHFTLGSIKYFPFILCFNWPD